jgi:hypothetical protein
MEQEILSAYKRRKFPEVKDFEKTILMTDKMAELF